MAQGSKKETYRNFLGIDNINDSTKIIKRIKGIPYIRFIKAENVDLHTDSRISRCGGYTLKKAGSYTSVWSNNDICLAINSGDLIQIHPDISTSVLLQNVGNNDMAYESVSDGSALVVYFTNSTLIGKIKGGTASLLPATKKEFKDVLPAGNMIKFFQGSLYIIRGKVVYLSDVLNKEIYDRRWGFKLFESDIKMFEPVKDGIYVSDSSKVYFMHRTGTTADAIAAPVFTLVQVFDAAAIQGTPYKVFDITSPAGKKMEQAIIWVSGQTLCLGGDGGQFETIRSGEYKTYLGQKGTGVFRVNKDLNQYITIIR